MDSIEVELKFLEDVESSEVIRSHNEHHVNSPIKKGGGCIKNCLNMFSLSMKTYLFSKLIVISTVHSCHNCSRLDYFPHHIDLYEEIVKI